MKLIIFIHSLARGGAERVTANLANHLQGEGWAVTIVTVAAATLDSYELHPSVRRVALDMAGESGGAIEAMANNIRRLRRLREVLREQRPDAALGMMNTASSLLFFASRGLNIVTLGAERANPSTAPMGFAWSRVRRAAYRRLDAVIALTPEAAQWLRAHAGARNIAVIPNAVMWPLPDQAPQVDPQVVGIRDRKRLLAVGRLSRVKGYDRLLAAFAMIAARHTDWELVIVGEGPERSTLEGMIERGGLAGQVFLAGEVGNLSDWYHRADLLVLSSRHEGFPNVVLEAMSHGVPCVSFDCEAGPRNIIRHGVDGLLATNQDPQALASAMEQLMSDDDKRKRFGEASLQVRERFASARILGMWRDLITEKVRRNG